MIVYLSKPITSTRELLQLINKFSKVTGYKSNLNKSVAFRYSKDNHVEKEIREKVPFTIVTKSMKYLGVTLTNKTTTTKTSNL